MCKFLIGFVPIVGVAMPQVPPQLVTFVVAQSLGRES